MLKKNLYKTLLFHGKKKSSEVLPRRTLFSLLFSFLLYLCIHLINFAPEPITTHSETTSSIAEVISNFMLQKEERSGWW